MTTLFNIFEEFQRDSFAETYNHHNDILDALMYTTRHNLEPEVVVANGRPTFPFERHDISLSYKLIECPDMDKLIEQGIERAIKILSNFRAHIHYGMSIMDFLHLNNYEVHTCRTQDVPSEDAKRTWIIEDIRLSPSSIDWLHRCKNKFIITSGRNRISYYGSGLSTVDILQLLQSDIRKVPNLIIATIQGSVCTYVDIYRDYNKLEEKPRVNGLYYGIRHKLDEDILNHIAEVTPYYIRLVAPMNFIFRSNKRGIYYYHIEMSKTEKTCFKL